jgi:hypothetical protein
MVTEKIRFLSHILFSESFPLYVFVGPRPHNRPNDASSARTTDDMRQVPVSKHSSEMPKMITSHHGTTAQTESCSTVSRTLPFEKGQDLLAMMSRWNRSAGRPSLRTCNAVTISLLSATARTTITVVVLLLDFGQIKSTHDALADFVFFIAHFAHKFLLVFLPFFELIFPLPAGAFKASSVIQCIVVQTVVSVLRLIQLRRVLVPFLIALGLCRGATHLAMSGSRDKVLGHANSQSNDNIHHQLDNDQKVR